MKKRTVRQYTRAGKFIAEYDSIRAAAMLTGMPHSSISSACSGIYTMAGNCIWRYADEVANGSENENIQGLRSFMDVFPEMAKDWSPENPAGPDEVLPTACVKVLWICPAGHPDYWMMPKDRAWGRGCPVCARLRKQAYYKKISKPVYQMKWNGQIIAEYPSISAASRETEILHSTISLACNGKCQTAGGFRWCFAPKDEEDL